jgi:hypothetical protein
LVLVASAFARSPIRIPDLVVAPLLSLPDMSNI